MARFYARFDAGADTDGLGFTRLRVGANSASGALLRDGLIASRSLLSTDVYEDLDSVNKDGTKGVYFPTDAPGRTTNTSTFVSWSTAYTSSIEGIKTPTSNEYGVGNINYSKRPTASVAYSSSGVVQANPVDPIGVSYETYYSASNAVRTVLNSIQSQGDTATTNIPAGGSVTPFGAAGRPGGVSLSPERTLYSVWNDPSMSYFAWDDFTPGTASLLQQFDNTAPVYITGTCIGNYINLGNPISTDLIIITPMGPFQFASDAGSGVKIGFQITLASSSGQLLTIETGYNDYNLAFDIATNTSSYGPVSPRTNTSSSWDWEASVPQLKWTIGLPSSSYSYMQTQIRIYDQKINTNTSNGTFSSTLYGCSNSAFEIKQGDML